MNNIKFSFFRVLFSLFLISIFFSGCSNSNENKQSFDEKIFQSYMDTNRIEKYNELKEKYNGNRMILWWNEKEDAWWITNFSLWLFSLILPDLPQVLSGGVILIILFWLGAFGVGGAILAALATVGSAFFVLPGIPPAIMGIIWLGMAFSLLAKFFSFVWELLF